MMNNRQKLDLVVKMQRRTKIRRALWLVLFMLLAGALLVYSQFRHAIEG